MKLLSLFPLNFRFASPSVVVLGYLCNTFLGTLAEIYVDELSELTSRGKEQRAIEGNYNGSIPTGYCNGLCTICTDVNGPGYCPLVGRSPLGNGETLVPHPLESQAVCLAFDWYATGHYSDADIAHKLNQHQVEFEGQTYQPRIKSRRKPEESEQTPDKRSGLFTHDTVRDMLNRRFYTGVVEYCGGQGVAEERTKFKKAKAIYDGNHPALITTALYDQVQLVRRRRGNRPNRAKNKTNERIYPLSRILYSWPMRTKMRAVANGSNIRQYRDTANIGRSKLDASPRSSQPTIKAEPLEAQVLEALETLTLPDEWQYRILAYLVSAEGGLADVERQRRHLYARFEHLNKLYLDGSYPADQYEREKMRIEKEMADLLFPADLDNAEVQALMANPAQLWRQATPAELKDLFKTVFQRIYVQDTDIVRLVAHPAFLEYLADPHQRIVGPADEDVQKLALPDLIATEQ